MTDELRAELVSDALDQSRTATSASNRRFRLAPADEPICHLDAHEGHVEAGDTTEVGYMLSLGRYRDRQPAGVDAADDHQAVIG
jgi:hypothetical protein